MDAPAAHSKDIDTATALAELFARHRGRRWYFGHAGGNWGDYLIWAGAEKLARETGLIWTNFDFRCMDSMRFEPDAAIYLHGGGCLNPWYDGRAFTILHAALAVPGAVVIQGPQTCDVTSEETRRLFAHAFAGAFAAEVHLYAREWTSARFMAGLVPASARIYLAEDCAFLMSRDGLLALAGLPHVPRGRYMLLASRADTEAPAIPTRLRHGSEVMLDPAEFAKSFPHWLRLHASASRIVTDRLHSAIVGTILGKPVALMPGNYHKNRSMWEFSLRSRGVAWHGSAEERGEADVDGFGNVAKWLPPRIASSRKLRLGLLWLQGVPLK